MPISSDQRKFSISKAKRLLTEGCLILDTETTGFKPNYHEIIQIGIIKHTGDMVYSSYIKPLTPVDEEGDAYKIHHISNEMLKNAPTLIEIYDTLWNYLSDQVVVAYNSKFDMGMLRGNLVLNILPQITVKEVHCLMTMYQDYRGGDKCKLVKAIDEMGIGTFTEHEALADCYDSLALMKAIAVTDEDEHYPSIVEVYQNGKIKVLLCEEDYQLGIYHGNLRNSESRKRGYKSWKSPEDSLAIDIAGATAEVAFARAIGVEPDLKVNTFHDPDIAGFQIRSTKYKTGSLIFRGGDHEEDVFVLLTGERYEWMVVGMIRGSNCIKPEHLYMSEGKPNCWMVPQQYLQPFDINILEEK